MTTQVPYEYSKLVDYDYGFLPEDFFKWQQQYDGSPLHCFWCGQQSTNVNAVDKKNMTCDKCRRDGLTNT